MSRDRKLAGGRDLQIALAGMAYDQRRVRIVESDLSGCDHIVASRRGLFAVNPREVRLVAHGLFFGVTVQGADLFAFEACDRPRTPSHRGRIVRFHLSGQRIVSAEVYAQDFDNGCHGIDLVGDTLLVTDTYNQRIVTLEPDGRAQARFPLVAATPGSEGYSHVNSVLAVGDRRLVLLHNGGRDRASEVALLDDNWRILDRFSLPGRGCHDLAVLEDGSLLVCGSFAGELIVAGERRIGISDLMTRGLSVGSDTIVAGGSPFSERDARDGLLGSIYFMDRDYRIWATLQVPAPPTSICRIDGADFSLSNHVGRLGIRLDWPVEPHRAIGTSSMVT